MNYTIGNTNTHYRTLGIAAGFCILLCLIFSGARAQNPSASFTSSVFSGCAPLSVDFTNLSVQANSYYWDFGKEENSARSDYF